MVLLLLIAGPATYLMRVSGLLLARTRLVPKQMESTLSLVSTAALAALVAPGLLLPQGRLAANPLANPRLLVALLVLPLILLLRRKVQVMLLLTLLAGMFLLWGLLWLPGTTITLSLPQAALLLAGAGLLLLGIAHLAKGRVAEISPAVHVHCPACWCDLPAWAHYCGRCGLPQPNTARVALPLPRPVGARRLAVPLAAPVLDLAPTQPPAVVAVRPRRSASAFWLVWTGQTVSALGSAFTLFALPLLVYQMTHSALTLGLATATELLPYLLFGLPIGAWVDRLPRKRLLLLITGLQAGTLAVIPGLFLLGALTSVWWLYGVAFVSTTLKLGAETCQVALVPSVVEPERLVSANGRLQAGVSTAQLLGPVLAGALVLLVPLPLLLLMDAASFLIAAGLFAGIQVRFQQEAAPTRQRLRQAMGEGLRYMWHDPILRSISLLTPLVNGLSIVAVAQLVLFARVQYHANPSAISLLYAATSGGYLLFSLLAGPLRRLPFPVTTLGALALMGLLIGLLAFTPWFWLGGVLWGLSQGAEMLFNLHTRSLRQTIVPPELLGRVMSVAYVLAYSTSPVGALVGGLVIAWVGTAQIAWVFAALGGLIVVLSLAFAGTPLGRAGHSLPGTHGKPRAQTPRPAAPVLSALPGAAGAARLVVIKGGAYEQH